MPRVFFVRQSDALLMKSSDAGTHEPASGRLELGAINLQSTAVQMSSFVSWNASSPRKAAIERQSGSSGEVVGCRVKLIMSPAEHV